MVHPLRAAAAAALLLLGGAAAAEGPERLELAVGEVRRLGSGQRPMCDDPAVAVLSAEGALRAVGPGETTCSMTDLRAVRRIFRVVVKKPPAGQGAG